MNLKRMHTSPPFFYKIPARIAIAALIGWGVMTSPSIAQNSAADIPLPNTQKAAEKSFTLDDIQYFLGPVALYPDPLLALILPAATYPAQIDEAALWISQNKDSVQRREFGAVDTKDWDASIKALIRFPDIIEMLASHPDWSRSLGMAYAQQPDDVTAMIQLLRSKAVDVGNLKTTPEQVVETRQEEKSRVTYITPANPEQIYVPAYDSTRIYSSVVPGAILFGTGVAVGAAWNSQWGWNNRRWNDVWVVRPSWHAPPVNWQPHRTYARPVRPDMRRMPSSVRSTRSLQTGGNRNIRVKQTNVNVGNKFTKNAAPQVRQRNVQQRNVQQRNVQKRNLQQRSLQQSRAQKVNIGQRHNRSSGGRAVRRRH